jgi:hypothetical protein
MTLVLTPSPLNVHPHPSWRWHTVVLGTLRQGLGSDNDHTRCVAVSAVKHLLLDRPHPVDDLLKVGGLFWCHAAFGCPRAPCVMGSWHIPL